ITNSKFYDLQQTVQHTIQATSADLKDSISQLDSVLSLLSRDVRTISEHVKTEQCEKILSWVSSIKYDNAHYSDNRIAMAGTGRWLLESRGYLQWRQSTSP